MVRSFREQPLSDPYRRKGFGDTIRNRPQFCTIPGCGILSWVSCPRIPVR
jgi:hypothetical protein